MKLSEMRQTLEERGILLTKALGQNFLHDANQLDRIVATAAITKSDRVLEIGPGLGPLTERLLKKAGQVLAVELDKRLVEFLKARFDGVTALRLVHADALEFLRDTQTDWTGWKVVSNLPYSVASPILVELASAPKPPEKIVSTLQWEVVKRLLAKAGGKEYGILTLLVTQRFQPVTSFRIPASCFFPQPSIDSGCVSLQIRDPQPLPHPEVKHFQTLVKLAFSQRRKMMSKLLRGRWTAEVVQRAMEECGLSALARAEQLTLEEFIQLTNRLNS